MGFLSSVHELVITPKIKSRLAQSSLKISKIARKSTVHSQVLNPVPANIVQLIKKIQDHGYKAYLVGGCVRDMLTGVVAKDFDVATDARPKQLLKIFRGKSSIIGRRFPIVHVYYSQYRTEVTTFRGTPPKQSPYVKTSRNGQILVDNHYGTELEDAFRRDLTINALYYDPISKQITDYIGGLTDIKSRKVSMIGNPDTRFREDSVRMLRCIRLANKLEFIISKPVEKSIKRNAKLIRTSAPARLFEELLKMSLGGQAQKNFEKMLDLNLFQSIFTPLYTSISTDEIIFKQSKKLFEIALRNTDKRIAKKQTVTPSFLLAVLFWPNVRIILGNTNPINRHQIQLAGRKVISDHQDIFRIPKRFSIRMLNFWQMQHDLQWPLCTSASNTLEKNDFRAAFDFLEVREQSGEMDNRKTYQWWKQLQQCKEHERNELIERLPKRKNRKNTITLSNSYFVSTTK